MNQSIYHLNTVNLNMQSSWFNDQPVGGTDLSAVNITQLEKDTLLVCLESKNVFRYRLFSIISRRLSYLNELVEFDKLLLLFKPDMLDCSTVFVD